MYFHKYLTKFLPSVRRFLLRAYTVIAKNGHLWFTKICILKVLNLPELKSQATATFPAFPTCLVGHSNESFMVSNVSDAQ